MDDTAMEYTCSIIKPFITTMRQVRVTRSKCKVCGDSAEYCYYGAIVCQSCKIFFKRNAPYGQDKVKCHFNNRCVINVNNRHTCSACRLKMCFANGMSTDKIRGSHGKKSPDSTRITSILCNNQKPPKEIRISNLFKSDPSTLTADQWNLLSNLVQCYDEYSPFSFVEFYVHSQNTLPVKLRFKFVSVRAFFTVMMAKIQFGIEKNRDLLPLSSKDRMTLMRGTVPYTSSFGSMLMLQQQQLFDYDSFYKSAETIFGSNAMIATKNAIHYFDPDCTLMKLMFTIVAASTIKCTIYTNYDNTNLTNIKTILSIQNTYIELAWRYALYKYGYHNTVIRFLNFTRCLLFVNEAVIEANQSQQFTDMLDTVTAQIEQIVGV